MIVAIYVLVGVIVACVLVLAIGGVMHLVNRGRG